MTQMQPDAPDDSLVDNEGVNAGSDDDLLERGSGDVLGGGTPETFDPDQEPGDETQQGGELAGAPGGGGADPEGGESGQDVGLIGP
jgi:hypothetical protein